MTPGKSSKAEASPETTSRWVALAVAAMIRSRAPRGSALLAHRDQELGMRSGDRRVVGDNGDDLFDLIDELPTAGPVNVVG
jgi:hypothetical protein